MNEEQLDALIAGVNGLRAAAFCNQNGAVSDQSTGFDADVPCAVATISCGQLEELGRELGAGALIEWSMTTQAMNVYVLRRDTASLVVLGEPDEKGAAIAEKIAGFIAT